MAKTARAAIEDLLTCESCQAFYYVERAEDGARTRLRCTSCGHSRDVLLSGAKTNKWTVIDPNGDVKAFTEWDDLVRSMAGSVVTAVRAKLPSDNPVSDRAMSERPPTAEKAPSERPAVQVPAIPPMHEVQPIGPSVGPSEAPATNVASATSAATEEEEEKPKSMSGAALLDLTPTPMAPALSLEDSAPVNPPSESDKSIEISMSEPSLPAAPESKPEALVEALVSAMPEASSPPAAVEKTADIAPVAAKTQEPWDDDEAEVLSMRDIQVVPVTESTPANPANASGDVEITEKDKERESRSSSTPPPPARGALRTLPPARLGAPPPPTITFEDAKKSDPPPAVAKKDSAPPAKAKEDAKSDPPKKTDAKKSDVAVAVKDKDKDKDKDKKDDSRVANTVPPKRGADAAKPVATAKAQAGKPEEGGRSWLMPALGVAAAAGVVWYLANGSGGTPVQNDNPTATPTTTAAPTTTTASTEKPNDPSTTTTTTATATATTSASALPTEKAGTPTVKPADTAKPANPTTPENETTATPPGEKKPATNANLSMSEALDKAGQAKRGGDYAAAKELYARVLKESPANVEAHSGLGDIARAQGDLAAAKASYQKALAASPDYGPAVLNLADTEWDMGDRASAQARYAKIVAARGGSAPQRAKERAGTE